MAAQDALTPRPEHRFTFGLWTVGNRAQTRSAARRARRWTRSTRCGAWPSSAHGA